MKAARPAAYFDAVYFDRADHLPAPRKSNYARYTRQTADFAGRAEALARIAARYSPALTVLDVGCAKGYLVAELQRRGVDASGVDCSAYAVGEGRKEGIGDLHLGSATDLFLFADRSFDLVVSWDVLEHLDETQVGPAIAECARVAGHGFAHHVNTGEDPATHFAGDESHTDPHPQRWWDARFARHGSPVSDAGITIYRVASAARQRV